MSEDAFVPDAPERGRAGLGPHPRVGVLGYRGAIFCQGLSVSAFSVRLVSPSLVISLPAVVDYVTFMRIERTDPTPGCGTTIPHATGVAGLIGARAGVARAFGVPIRNTLQGFAPQARPTRP